MTLSGINSYSGVTYINEGILSISSVAALPGWDEPGRYNVAARAVLMVGDGVTAENTATMLRTGKFMAGSIIDFDVTATRTLDGSFMPSNSCWAKSGPGTMSLSNALAAESVSVSKYWQGLWISAALPMRPPDRSVSLGGIVQNGTLKKNGGISMPKPAPFLPSSPMAQLPLA